MHLGNGLQTGAQLMNILNAVGQSLLFCESVPQSLRGSDMRTITPLEFRKQMHYLLVFPSGAETGELIQLLSKYQYERVTNSTGVNTFKSRSVFHPFHSHSGQEFSVNQQRTLWFKKDMFKIVICRGYSERDICLYITPGRIRPLYHKLFNEEYNINNEN